MDKRHFAIGVLAGAIAFLVLFGSGHRADAVTYKTKYSTRLSCAGSATGPASCVEGTYGANGAGLTADILSHFEIPTAMPLYSRYQHLATFGTPAGWTLATDKELPDGAKVGHVVSLSTLGLFGGKCGTVTLTVDIPLYDCSTDNSVGNLIDWNGAIEIRGGNLLYGPAGELPAGCTHYPSLINQVIGSTIKPRARYFGSTVITANMTPTQLELVTFSPDQLSSLPAPEASMIDDLGNINYVILDNPLIPAPAGDAFDEYCTPLSTDTTLWGRTNGSGRLNAAIPPVPSAQGDFWAVQDACNDSIDNDGDTTVNQMCGLQRAKNPNCGLTGVTNRPGLWGTCSYLVGAYSDSYRDADNDGVDNNTDECPFTVDQGVDSDNDRIDNACDPTPTNPPPCPPAFPQCHGDGYMGMADEDNDGWRNQADNCPLVAQTDQNDTDGDFIGDACDTVGAGGIGLGPNVADGKWVNDQPSGSICIGAADTDGDGWCDATENIIPTGSTQVLSIASRAGEKAGESEAAGNASAPGVMPTNYCTDLIDNDSDTYIDAADAGCSTPEYKALDYAVVSATDINYGSPGAAPKTCTNYQYYDSTLNNPNPHKYGAGLPVDDDADTTANQLDANCTLPMTGDTDLDGIVDASDNCPLVWNPTQLDMDGDQKPGQSPPSVPGGNPNNWFGGDACDPDDDGDSVLDTTEWTNGTDAKNICDPINFDVKADNMIDILDIGMFKYPLRKIGSPARPKTCFPPKDYNVCR
jgi:hypothetical protein